MMGIIKELYENGKCPDCYLKIPENATEGDGCENCEHVFNALGKLDDAETMQFPGVIQVDWRSGKTDDQTANLQDAEDPS